MPRRTKEEMKKLKQRAISLIQANPTLSINRVAEHVGVSAPTVSRWFAKENLRRWFS